MNELNIGDYIYIINEYGKHLRKVTWKNEYYFEWNSGYSEILYLDNNPTGKVKFTLNTLKL